MTAACSAGDFAASMARLGPFETAPELAVACSGGADSMALALLAHDWAKSAGGRVTALIVDHAMRRESAGEAETVRSRLAGEGIEAVILTRQGRPLTADKQAAARRARYRLMTEWCRDRGVLHLLLGHHRGDQAETLMLRLGRGSGVEGLAAMAPVSENAYLRLLRPLLDAPRESLIGYLRARQMEWVEDPSNQDAAFARVRMRRLLPDLGAEGLTEARLAGTARRMARARIALEDAATALLGRAVAIYPEGYALLTAGELLAAPEETGLRALSRLLTCIGGSRHGPRLGALERLYGWIAHGQGAGRTLAGCRIGRMAGGRLLVCRETSAIEPAVPAVAGALWDGRFHLAAACGPDEMLTGLGREGWAMIGAQGPRVEAAGLPAVVRNALPAVKGLEQVAEVPHLLYRKMTDGAAARDGARVTFLPRRPLTAARFSAVPGYA